MKHSQTARYLRSGVLTIQKVDSRREGSWQGEPHELKLEDVYYGWDSRVVILSKKGEPKQAVTIKELYKRWNEPLSTGCACHVGLQRRMKRIGWLELRRAIKAGAYPTR
jgi:hypothetical protein